VKAAARSRSADRRYYGVVEAIVTEVVDDGDEARVKLKFPWFDDGMVTEWCRVAQPYAGNGYGFVFVPEQNDEVLVAFIHGDMRMPIVIGGLYNGKDKPPTSRKKDRDQKMVRTKLGHELLLDDTKKTQRTRIKTAGKQEIDVDDAGKKVTVKSAEGHSVVMDDGAKSIEVRTSEGQSVKLDGKTGTVTVSGTTVTLSAGTVNLGGPAAAQSLVLGELFMTLFNAHVHTTTIPTFPTSPPVTPMTPALLSKTSKTAL
jgi:phage baseplate assembly protein V